MKHWRILCLISILSTNCDAESNRCWKTLSLLENKNFERQKRNTELFNQSFQRQTRRFATGTRRISPEEIANVSSNLASSTKLYLRDNGVAFRTLNTQPLKSLLILPDPNSSLGRFAKGLREKLGTGLRFDPYSMLMEGFEGAVDGEKRALYLSQYAVLQLKPTETEIHEVRHLKLEKEAKQQKSSFLLGWITPKRGSLSGFSLYREGFSLEELSTYPLEIHLALQPIRVWAKKRNTQNALSEKEMHELHQLLENFNYHWKREYFDEPFRMLQTVEELTRYSFEGESTSTAKNARIQNEGEKTGDLLLRQHIKLHQMAAKQIVLYQKIDDALANIVHSRDPKKLQDLINAGAELAEIGNQFY